MKRLCVLCVLTALVITGCGTTQEASAPKLLNPVGIDVDTATVKKMQLSNVNNIDGQIVPEIVDACFENSGNISEMKVEVGDTVKKGQLLATLSGETGNKKIKKMKQALSDLKKQNNETNKMSQLDIDTLALQKSELEKKLEKSDSSKEKKSLRTQIIEKNEDIQIAKAKLKHQKQLQQLEVDEKQKAIDEISHNGDKAELRAPIAGEVVSTSGGSGYMVQGGRPAVRIADMSKPRVMTDYVGDATLNKASSYYAVVDGKNYKVLAEEQEVDAMAVESGQGLPSQTFFDFTGSSDGVKIGSYALIQLNNDLVKDSLVVPVNAVNKDDNGKYVYKQVENQRVRTDIKVGTSTDAYVQVLTGLKEGDVVYVEG